MLDGASNTGVSMPDATVEAEMTWDKLRDMTTGEYLARMTGLRSTVRRRNCKTGANHSDAIRETAASGVSGEKGLSPRDPDAENMRQLRRWWR